MSRQMERTFFGLSTARQCESLKFFALSEGSSEAGGIVNGTSASSPISKPK